jgi:hypothetical protein
VRSYAAGMPRPPSDPNPVDAEARALARECVAWIREELSPDAFGKPARLIPLIELGIEVAFVQRQYKKTTGKYQRAVLRWRDREVEVFLFTWAETFEDLRRKGPFALVRPDAEPETIYKAGVRDEDGNEVVDYVICPERPVGVPFLIDEGGADKFIVDDAEVVKGLVKLVLGHDPGREKLLAENRFIFRVRALERFAAGEDMVPEADT